jgi:hypothetical protein
VKPPEKQPPYPKASSHPKAELPGSVNGSFTISFQVGNNIILSHISFQTFNIWTYPKTKDFIILADTL